MTRVQGRIGRVFVAVVGALGLSACVAAQPEPYYAPGYYGYAPGYYAQPHSTYVFSYQDGPRHHRRGHHGHHHRHRY